MKTTAARTTLVTTLCLGAAGRALAAESLVVPPPPEVSGATSWVALFLVLLVVVVTWVKARAWVRSRLDPALERLSAAATALEARNARVALVPLGQRDATKAGAKPIMLPLKGSECVAVGHIQLVLSDGPEAPLQIATDLLRIPTSVVALVTHRHSMAALARRVGSVDADLLARSVGRAFMLDRSELFARPQATLSELASLGFPSIVVVDLAGEGSVEEVSKSLGYLVEATTGPAEERGVAIVVGLPEVGDEQARAWGRARGVRTVCRWGEGPVVPVVPPEVGSESTDAEGVSVRADESQLSDQPNP